MTESLLTFALKAAILAARELNVLAKGEIAATSNLILVVGAYRNQSHTRSHCLSKSTYASTARHIISHNVYYVQSLSEDARVPLASITGLAMPSQEASLPSVPLAAWQLRLSPSSDQGLVHDPSDPAADQAAPPRQ
jgi:hypothetical protein